MGFSIDGNWAIGSCYELKFDVILREEIHLNSPVLCEMDKGVTVHLFDIQTATREDGNTVSRALVKNEKGRSGWVSLENRSGLDLLEKRALKGSWCKGGRYRVTNWTELRQEVSLDSAFIRELMPGEEVLVMDLQSHPVADSHVLRARINTRQNEVGWTSCTSTDASRTFLDPEDINKNDVKELARTVTGSVLSPDSRSPSPPSKSLISSGKRASFMHQVEKVPWETGGKYTVLGERSLRAGTTHNSKKIRSIKAGETVRVKEIQDILEKSAWGSRGKRFRALVECDKTKSIGWIYCESKDGTPLLDTRDLLEFEKMQKKLQEIDQARHRDFAMAARILDEPGIIVTDNYETPDSAGGSKPQTPFLGKVTSPLNDQEAPSAPEDQLQRLRNENKRLREELESVKAIPQDVVGWSKFVLPHMQQDFLKWVDRSFVTVTHLVNGTSNGYPSQSQAPVGNFVQDIIQLQDMGFPDAKRNFEALRQCESIQDAAQWLDDKELKELKEAELHHNPP